MLLILTGEIQIGKTRWLQELVCELQEEGVAVSGVIAPGIWVERPDGQVGADADRGMAEEGRYEKLGINNLLLPQGQLVPFARRRDLSQADGTEHQSSQSSRAQLGWDIDDAAIAQVNAHFDQLAQSPAPPRPGLLVVDELGRLELMREEGLTSALDALSAGPSPLAAHALVVVREGLLDLALQTAAQRFSLWGEARPISPGEDAARLIRSLLGA
ncbi:MAG: hypothetical protein PUA57_05785, partial [Eggerthellales bacterium]|nr:hypothetical protein [Eggerthellales bacterium]